MHWNYWYVLKEQNLSKFMRGAGYDLSVYYHYHKEVQAVARKAAIKSAMEALDHDFYDQSKGSSIWDVEYGVYVISLADGLCIKYRNRPSDVIYIGMGYVAGRLQQHFEYKLFDMMMSLAGANFTFYVANPWKKYYRYNDYHKQVEYDLLQSFVDTYGGLDDRYCFPLMNRIHGADMGLTHDSQWWRKPLKSTGKRWNWAIEPIESNQFHGSLD